MKLRESCKPEDREKHLLFIQRQCHMSRHPMCNIPAFTVEHLHSIESCTQTSPICSLLHFRSAVCPHFNSFLLPTAVYPLFCPTGISVVLLPLVFIAVFFSRGKMGFLPSLWTYLFFKQIQQHQQAKMEIPIQIRRLLTILALSSDFLQVLVENGPSAV